MDRNTSNEPVYRPMADAPASHMPYGELDGRGIGPRQVLARMPNLSSVDPDTDPVGGYSQQDENRVLSSGMSMKVLLGAFISLLLAAILGFYLAGRKTTSETPPSEASWQPQSPAPAAEQSPRWDGVAGGNSNWQPGTSGNSAPSDGYTPATTWNTPAGQSQPGASSPPPNTAWGNPTQVTATPTQTAEALWGQAQESPAAAWTPPAPATVWNPGPNPPAAEAATQSTWPSPIPTSTGMGPQPSRVANPHYLSGAADSTVPPAYSGGYQQVQPSPSYAASQAGVNQSMSLSGQAAGQPATPAYRPATEPPVEQRFGYNTYPAANPAGTQQQPAAGPAAGTYYSADTRSNNLPFYGASPQAPPLGGTNPAGVPAGVSSPANGSFPVPVPVTYPGSSYPANNSPATGYPTNSTPATGYPTSYPASNNPSAGYPANNTPATGYPTSYPANGYSPTGYPMSYPASGGANNPAATAPVGAPFAPQYGTGASTVTPQSGGAQFQGVIEKPTVQASYDRTRPSVY